MGAGIDAASRGRSSEPTKRMSPETSARIAMYLALRG
jgi:hypothetical protein